MASEIRDVVVLIPGIAGSVLQRDGRDLWALSAGAALRAVLSLGGNIQRLTLDGDDPDADDLGDGIVATRVLPDLHIVPGLDWKIDGYARFGQRLRERFGCVPGENYFELPYDWRRDNRVAARALARNAHTWLKRWRGRSGNADAKLVLVGHSMGGIVARLYLELLGGWRDTRTLITFGTPYSGSINALDFLANGFKRGWGPFTVDLSDMIGSFTSAYQLLPSYRCLEGPTEGRSGSWLNLDEVDWTGSAVDADRMRAALGLHRELRAAVDARLERGDPGYVVRPVIGHFQPTGWAARLAGGGRIEALTLRELREQGGDGTVPTISATPHEALKSQRNLAFFSQRHASLQNDDAVHDHLGGLLVTESLDPVDVFAAPDEAIALEVADTPTGEPLVIRATVGQLGAALVATVEPLDGSAARTAPLQEAGDGWQQVVLDGLAATDYRVTVAGTGLSPVTDIASVVDLNGLEEAAQRAGREP